MNEEDLRRHFKDLFKSVGGSNVGQDSTSSGVNDGILNVRVIRDPSTHLGKGFAFV